MLSFIAPLVIYKYSRPSIMTTDLSYFPSGLFIVTGGSWTTFLIAHHHQPIVVVLVVPLRNSVAYISTLRALQKGIKSNYNIFSPIG